MGLAVERIPIDVYKLKKLREEDVSIREKIRELAGNLSIDNFLNGHTVQEIKENIQKYKCSEEEIKPAILLTVGHANNLLAHYNKKGFDLDFRELLELKKKFPELKNTILVSYAVAKRDPQLAGVAHKMLDGKPVANILIDPHINYNPLSNTIAYINKEALQPADIYNRTNAEDEEFRKENEQQLAVRQEDIKKFNMKRLSNLELAAKNDPNLNEDVKRQEYRNTFVVST